MFWYYAEFALRVAMLVAWLVVGILYYMANKNRAKAEERNAMHIYLLYKEIKRVNDRISCNACAGKKEEKAEEKTVE